MLSFSQTALDLMAKPVGCCPVFRLEYDAGGGTWVDVTDSVHGGAAGLSELRQNVQPISLQLDPAHMVVTLDNGAGWWSPDVADSYISGTTYHGLPFRLRAGVMLPTGLEELLVVFQGVLDSLEWDAGQKTADLKVVDLFEKLRAGGTGDKAGTVLADDSPAGIILTLTGATYANLPASLVDTAALEALADRQRLDRVLVRRFTLTDGSYWDNLAPLFAHGRFGLRVSGAGKMQPFQWEPGSSSTAMALGYGSNLARLRAGAQFATIRNAAKVSRQKSDYSGTQATAASPVQDSGSQTAYGKRWDREKTFSMFTEDVPAEQAAFQELYLTSSPRGVVEAEADFSALPVELGDMVTITTPATDFGWTSRPAQVYGKTLDLGGLRVQLTLLDSYMSQQPWLYIGGGNLDAGKKAW